MKIPTFKHRNCAPAESVSAPSPSFADRPQCTPDNITQLREDEVFVFGSNLGGHHGAGAAAYALAHFGAINGVGAGPQGQSYAIPTMHGGPEAIRPYVKQFAQYAQAHKETYFYVTRIGCGIAGFADEEIAPLFAPVAQMNNVCLPKTFRDILAREKKSDEKADGRTHIYNVIILDRSGSMDSMRTAAIDGFNETLATVQKAQKQFGDTQEHNISLVTFSSDGLEKLYSTTPVGEAKPLKAADYIPSGCTPLYDAMGATLTAMRKKVATEDDAMVMVTIITDGYENTSREYTANDIKTLTAQLREEGWTFTYLGANQDAVEAAAAVGIRNARNFEASDSGFRASMFDANNIRFRVVKREAEEAQMMKGMSRKDKIKHRNKRADEEFDKG